MILLLNLKIKDLIIGLIETKGNYGKRIRHLIDSSNQKFILTVILKNTDLNILVLVQLHFIVII